MTIEELAALVFKMRMAQQRYFARREREDLLESRRWEREVDTAVSLVIQGKYNESPR